MKFIVAIQLTVEADNKSKARDTIGNILSDHDLADGALADWEYMRLGPAMMKWSTTYSRYPELREVSE